MILVFHVFEELFHRRPFKIHGTVLVQRLASVRIVISRHWLDDRVSLHFDDLGRQQAHERTCRLLFGKRTDGEDILGSLPAIDARENKAFIRLEVFAFHHWQSWFEAKQRII